MSVTTPSLNVGAHTPEPWGFKWFPNSDAERSLAAGEWTGVVIFSANDDGALGHSLFEGAVCHGDNEGDPEADLRLMCAAPKLLSSIQEFLDWLGDPPTSSRSIADIKERAQAAIALAKSGPTP